MKIKDFTQLLAKHGVVDADAVENPDSYDNRETLDRIFAAYRELEAHESERFKAGWSAEKP
jgi:hypothetical protein